MTELSEYRIRSIAGIIRGKLISEREDDATVRDLLIDSRKLTNPDFCLFFALVTKRNDGHKYVHELYSKGVRNFVISQMSGEMSTLTGANFILVSNTLTALQMLAAHYRRNFGIPVIGITGSNGKTIVKEWLYQILSEDKKVIRSPKSFNSQVGVPLSVWQMKPDDEIAIFEAGISEPDEMDKLQSIILPTLGIFTNIGPAHDENFININQKVAEKLKLFTKVSALIYSTDYVDITSRIVQTEAFRKIKTFTWGNRKENDLVVTEIASNNKHTAIRAEYGGQSLSISIPFSDRASSENALHCWAVMLFLGYPQDIIASRMAKLSPVAMRLELKEGINACSIINDSYSSDFNSLEIALDFLRQQKQHKKKTVILSDLLQSGRNENELYQQIADLLKNKGIDFLIGIGPTISRHASKFRMENVFFNSTDDFLRTFPFSSFHNESILIKGARLFEFEQIGKALQQKAHETVLEINLNALVHNLNAIRGRLKPETKIMVIVKAFSYGSGSFEIANVLQFHHVDYLAVAFADEGVELRKAGITLPIMVMNPDEESIDALSKYNLEPEVYSFRILELLEDSRNRVYLEHDKPTLIHIKLDTGMHRLGFEEQDLDRLIERLANNPALKVGSVFSHFAASHDPLHDDYSRFQIESFRRMARRLQDALPYDFMLHILNSAGISRFSDAQFDMVRLGIGLYGVPSDERDQELLQNVSTLKSSISQVKIVRAGETIGYNRAWTAENDMTIGIVPVGYADGLNRKLSNAVGKLTVNGELRPIVGNICMDMCMVDITGLDVKEGDPVYVFGETYPISMMAKDLDTIPYEVLTSISRRVKRVYFQE